MKKINFREKLRIRQEKTKSLLCIGLDPLPEKLPACLQTPGPYHAHLATDIAYWMMRIADATSPYASMYKLQRAHWEAFPGGTDALRMVIIYIARKYPDIPIFTDCKRGDIDRTQSCYRVAQLEIDGSEGMNFSPYMGKDCMQYLVDEKDKSYGLVGLAYTSNPKAREVQDEPLAKGQPYWEFIAEKILAWSEDLGVVENSGLVMAAAYEFPKGSGSVYSEHLIRVREIVGDKLWLLIPGVGTQGGFIKQTVKAAFVGYGSMAINSSSGIIFASSGEDYAEAAAEQARLTYVAIAEALGIERFDRIQESLIVPNNPLQTLKNCNGYYTAFNKTGEIIGPLVAYNGTYPTGKIGENEQPVVKNFVGAEYYDFAFAEKLPAVRRYFAYKIAEEILSGDIPQPEIFMGSAYGGILLAGSLGDIFSGSQVVFTTKKVLEAKTTRSKEKSVSALERHELPAGKKVFIVEDVSNNRTEVDRMISLAEEYGCEVIALVCAFNRSKETEYKNLPIISACHIPTEQWRQEDPTVADHIYAGNIELSPKNNFPSLLHAMEEYANS